MTATHQSILEELYGIDPSLRELEAELVPLIQQLLRNDPSQQPSPAFVKKLRKELAARMHATANGAVEHRVSYGSPSAFAAFFNRFAYATAGALAAVVIAVPTTLHFVERGGTTVPTGDAPFEKTADGDAAMFDTAGTGAPTPLSARPDAAPTMRTQSGGGGNPVSSLIAPWNPVRYRLEGDLPTLPTGTVDVLERRTSPLAVPFASIQNAFKDAAIDLSSFQGTSVDNITITQRTPFGYTINLSMQDGSVSINQAWEQWPHPESTCNDDACYERHRTTLSDIPADAESIRIANAFLGEHAIDLSSYGDPFVDNAWRTEFERAEDKRTAWVPDTVRVVYPLLVNGKPVAEAGGGAAGVSVQVSAKHKRVSDVWGLMDYRFDRTDRPAVSDRADIETFLNMTGGQTPDAPTIAVKDPTIGYARLYTYASGKNAELFVPALIFQITDVPDGVYYYQSTVAVPLAKDLLDEALQSVPIVPMPLEGGPAVDASTPLSTGSPAQEPLIMNEEVSR